MSDSPHITRIPADASKPPSTTRRVMPQPFQRPSISVGDTGPRRTWRYLPVSDVTPGDTVPGLGVIAEVNRHHSLDGDNLDWTVTLTGADGVVKVFFGGHEVYAFTSAPDA